MKKFIISLLVVIINLLNVVAITDNNPSNNIKNITINVVETEPLKIYYIAIDNVNNFEQSISKANEFINKTYPIADDKLISIISDSTINSNTSKLGDLYGYDGIAFLVQWKGLISSKFPTRSVGIVPVNWSQTHFTNKNWDGYAFVDTSIYTGSLVEEGFRHVVAHEIAHPYGLCEEYDSIEWERQNNLTNCPNADLDNNEIPDTNCLDEKTGCDTETIGKLVPWNNSNETIKLFNFMGSSNDENFRWVSNETYNILLNQLKVTNKITSSSTILVTGYIHKNGSTEIFNSYALGEANITTQNDLITGNHSIEILDANNNVLSNLSFKPSFTRGFADGNITNSNFSFFAFIMNFSQNLSKIQIKQNVTILNQRNRTPNTPSLNLTLPIGNELVSNKMNVTYNASDIDGNTINYAILISSDKGNTFSTLEIDHPNKTLTVNTSSFTEGKQYKVKVLATDGINTNTTISQTTFEIDNDLRITNLSTLHENKTKRIFHYVTKNTLEDNLSNINEQLNTGETIITSSTNHSLNPNEEIMVFVEYDYNKTGTKDISATATSGSFIESESFSITIPDIQVKNLQILNSSITKRLFGFNVLNNLNISITNLNWTLNAQKENISSLQPISLTASEELFSFVYYDFIDKGTYNVTITAFNGSFNSSQSFLVKVKDIRVDNLTVPFDNNTNKIFEFMVSNDWNTSLPAVNWTVNNSLSAVSANELASLLPSESLFIYVNYNFTTTGSFNVNASARNGTTLDSEVIDVSVT